MIRPFLELLSRDVRLALREGGAIGTALGFYLMVVAILPLGLGPDLNLLSRIAPGVLWIALLLSALLSADRIFHADHEDSTLEALALAGELTRPSLPKKGWSWRPQGVGFPKGTAQRLLDDVRADRDGE